jgi:hypothetical protein
VIATTLMSENQEAWEVWCHVMGQMINLAPMSSEPFFILDFHALSLVMEWLRVEEKESCYRKVRLLFSIWQKFTRREALPKTKNQFDKLVELKRNK